MKNIKQLAGFSTAMFMIVVGCTKQTPDEAISHAIQAEISVKKGQLKSELSWRGVVRSANRIEIRADKKMRIGKILVKNFDNVKKGQVLVEIDNSENLQKKAELKDRIKTLKLELHSTQVKFQQTQKNLIRKTGLANKGILPQKDVDESQTESKLAMNDLKSKEMDYEKAQKELHLVESLLSAANVLSPLSGVVSGLIDTQQESSEINSGQVIATVFDPKEFALWVQIEETNLQRVAIGKQVHVELDIIPNKILQGKVIEINPNANDLESPVKFYSMGVSVEGIDISLREGYAGKATLVSEVKENVLTVPIAAIYYLEGKEFVIKGSLNSAIQNTVPVKIGMKTDTEVEIISGVEFGEKLILKN